MSDRYEGTEFNSIRYLGSASNGQGSVPESDARHGYYGVSAFPSLVWMGTQMLVGAGTDVIDGAPYDAIMQAHLADATPWALSVTSHNFGPGAYATVHVELEDDIADISGHNLRICILEDDLYFGSEFETDVLRDIVADIPITIDMAGQTMDHTANFTMDGGWNAANMRVVAFIQRDSDKSVLQSCNSETVGDYSFRYYSLGERVAVDSGSHEFGEFALFNMGDLDDTYDISLDLSGLPGDWNAYITDGMTQFGSQSVPVSSGDRASFNVVVETGSSGGGTVVLNLHSQNARTDDRQLTYTVITADTEILLVDDDGADSFEVDYYAPALGGTGRSSATWDRNSATLTGDILANFDIVVWNVGFAFPTLDDSDREALGSYLDGGGALFVSGQDIGWELESSIGGAARDWYRQYLHADYIADNAADHTLDGVDGDFITNGMSIAISGGDGANNQEYPDDVDPFDSDAQVIFTYNASKNGALAIDTPTYRVVYLAFGFEAIDNATDRANLMERSILWLMRDLTGVPGDPGDTAPMALRLDQNLPNPFNPKTMIRFALPNTGQARLDVFDVEGRRVRVLANGNHDAGEYELSWDGRDDAGRSLSSGVYFYRLQAEDLNQTRKMLLLK